MAPTPEQILGLSGGSTGSSGTPTPEGILGLDRPAAASPTAKKGGGGGFLHDLSKYSGAHLVGKTASGLEHIAVNLPAGIAKLAVDDYHALGPAVHHPFGPGGLHHLIHHPTDVFALTPQGKQVEQATAESFQHPGRDPAFTLLNTLAILAPAARAAELATGASATGRAISAGGVTVEPEFSRSALGRTAQRASDAVLQSGKPGSRRETILQNKVGKVVTAQAKQAERLAKRRGQAVIALGKRLSPGEQKALQVAAEQAPLEGRITAAAARVIGAKTPASRAGHQVELDLLHQAKPHLEGGLTPKLQRVYAAMEAAAGDRETLLQSLGVLSGKSIQSRKTAAGRVALGAHYVEPTPGRLGVESPRLAQHRAYTERLQTVYDRAYDRAVKSGAKMVGPDDVLFGLRVVGPGKTLGSLPVTEAEAQARLSELEARHATFTQAVHERMFGGQTAEDKAEQLRRNAENAKFDRQQAGKTRAGKTSGRSGGKVQRRGQTVKQEQRTITEAEIDRVLELMGDAPAAVAMRAERAEIARLRAALQPEFGEKVGPLGRTRGTTNGAGRVVAAPGAARAERLGGALSVAKDRLEQMETAAARRVRRTGIVGQEQFTATSDAIRIPDVSGEKPLSPRAQAKVGGQGSIGHLRAPGSTTHEYTGAVRRSGLRRQDTTRLVGESALEAAKYAGLTHIHDLVRKAAAEAPTRADDVAVRLDNLKASERMPAEVRRFLAEPEQFFAEATPHERATMLDRVRSTMFMQPDKLDPAARAEFERLNAEGKIGWVPRRVLGELGNPNAPLRSVAPRKAVSAVDAVNNAQRFAILYLKPAYAIPNILGNLALNLVQQGWAAPRNLAQAARIVQRLAPDDYAAIDAAMGEGLARAVSAHGQGRLAGIVDKGASVWSKAVDTPFRRASFIHEARQEGFRTREQIHGLLQRDFNDPKLLEIGIRANRDAIDYENLSNVEREIVRRVVFFYPWVKGSTVYAGRFLRDHPVQAAAAGQVGEQGQQYSQAAFGDLPSYYEGLIPFGAHRALNPASAAILQTPAQVGMTVQGLLSGHIPAVAQAQNLATPALQLILAEIQRRKATGIPYPPDTPWWRVAEDVLVDHLPQVTLGRNIKDSGARPDKVFPPSAEGAAGQFLLGGLYPRPVNRRTLNTQARSEQRRLRTGY